MRVVSEQEYIANIKDYESLMLLSIEECVPFLRSDIELTGDGDIRIELMRFKLNTSLSLYEANNECRSYYAGHIIFIEYPSLKEARENVIENFMSLEDYAVHIICRNEELHDISVTYPDENVYVLIE